jgi:hypothetical protein
MPPPSPAASPCCYRKCASSLTTPSPSPRYSAPRRALSVVQDHQSAAADQSRATLAGELTGTLAGVSMPPLSFFVRKILIQRPQKNHLCQRVQVNPGRTDHFKSNAPRCGSGRTGIHQLESATCPALNPNRFKTFPKRQKLVKCIENLL